MLVVFYRHLGIHVTRHRNTVKTRRHPQNRKYTVRNVTQRRQRRTEPRPQEICTKNFVKFGRVVLEFERTDRQTDILITILRTPLGSEVTSKVNRWL